MHKDLQHTIPIQVWANSRRPTCWQRGEEATTLQYCMYIEIKMIPQACVYILLERNCLSAPKNHLLPVVQENDVCLRLGRNFCKSLFGGRRQAFYILLIIQTIPERKRLKTLGTNYGTYCLLCIVPGKSKTKTRLFVPVSSYSGALFPTLNDTA